VVVDLAVASVVGDVALASVVVVDVASVAVVAVASVVVVVVVVEEDDEEEGKITPDMGRYQNLFAHVGLCDGLGSEWCYRRVHSHPF
jgi:hypothetical protein